MRKIQLFKMVIVMGVLSLLSCSKASDSTKNENKTSKEEFQKSTKTIEAKLSDQKEELILTGKVEYDPDKVVSYTPLVNGIVDKTFFTLGDKVQKGQTMLTMRSSDLSSLQSESVAAESELKLAQRELQRAKSLYEDGMLSETEYIEAEGKLKQAQAEVSKIKNDMGVYGTSQGSQGFSIKAPMSGYVVEKNVSAGSTVSADGDPIFTIADLSSVWVVANVYASNLQFVKEGMDVDITTLSYPNQIFEGKIQNISQVFDPEEKVLKARIVMNNKDMKLKPEMSTVIKLKNEANIQYVTIPSDALIFDNNRYFVVVEDSIGKYNIRPVEIQGHNNDLTYISSGLSDGEKIVSKNQLLIYTGLKEE